MRKEEKIWFFVMVPISIVFTAATWRLLSAGTKSNTVIGRNFTGNLEEWRLALLDEHNYYRKLHDVRKLHFDGWLNEKSQEQVESYAKDPNLFLKNMQSQAYSGGNNFTFSVIAGPILTPKLIVKRFYNEIHRMDWSRPLTAENAKNSLHFTAMVWNRTHRFGAGVITVDKPELSIPFTYVLINYHPYVNEYNSFDENVWKAKHWFR